MHGPRRDLPPKRQQPWPTIVTSDHPHDRTSHLDRPGVSRLSVGLPRATFRELFPVDGGHDATVLDVVMPHPVYGAHHWVQVLNPDTTWPAARDLLERAHAFVVRKYTNTAGRGRDPARPATPPTMIATVRTPLLQHRACPSGVDRRCHG